MKRIIAYIVATIMMFCICVPVFAADTCQLNFNFGNDTLSGTVECTFYDSKNYDETTKTITITNGKAALTVSNTTAYYMMDYKVYNTSGEVLISKEGYAVTSLPESMAIEYFIESDKPYEGVGEDAKIYQIAAIMGITYDEAVEMMDEISENSTSDNVEMPDTPSNDTGTETKPNVVIGGTMDTEVEKTVDCRLIFNVINLYGVESIEIEHEGIVDTVPVNDYEFTYTFKKGKYVIKCDDCQPVTLNCDNEIVTNIPMKPERVVHLMKSTETLNVTVDNLAWSGQMNKGVRSFMIKPVDEVIIDDIDGQKYRLALSSGVHEYTLNLDESKVTTNEVTETPVDNVTNDNPFGIPPTSERGSYIDTIVNSMHCGMETARATAIRMNMIKNAKVSLLIGVSAIKFVTDAF